MENLDNLLVLLIKAPTFQLDPSIIDRLQNLIGKDDKDFLKNQIMHIIDDCVRYSLCSSFTLTTLHIIHESYLDGSKEDFNEENCPWRKTEN